MAKKATPSRTARRNLPDEAKRVFKVLSEDGRKSLPIRIRKHYQSLDGLEQYIRDLEWCAKRYIDAIQ
jgi:hypothetical protein